MSLPTRIRQNLRDQIDSPSSKITTEVSALRATLGYPLAFEPEWPMLWDALKSSYPDPATFVPTIAGVLSVWFRAFMTWLVSDENDKAVEKLLHDLNRESRLRLFLEAAPTSRPKTTWDSKRNGFVIYVPKAPPNWTASSAQAGFVTDLMALFEPPYQPDKLMEDPDAWADLSLESPGIIPVPGSVRDAVQGSDSFPELASIARPEELTKRPPYWLIVRRESAMEMTIEASHGPSLELLEAYLKKWCRGNPNRSEHPPLISIKLWESAFGLGLMYDSLSLRDESGRALRHAMLILAFIEGVLGYESVVPGSLGANVWEFKRMKGFK